MKKSHLPLCLLFFIIICTFSVNAQWQQAGGLEGGKVNDIAVSGNSIYAAIESYGVFVSDDNGGSWRNISKSMQYFGTKALVSTNIGLVVGESYIYLSTDTGLNWTKVSPYSFVTTFAVSGSNVYAGSYDGVMLSTNDGLSWITPANTNLGTNVRSLAVMGPDIVAGTDSGVFISSDTCKNWLAINTGLPSLAKTFSLAVKDTAIFAGTDSGMFVTVDHGASWTAINNGLTNAKILSLAVAGGDIYAGTEGGGIFLSSDNGANWTQVNNGLTGLTVFSIKISGSNVFAATCNGVFLTSNAGVSWTSVNSGLSGSTVLSLTRKGNDVLCGAYNGIFLSSDEGASWKPLNNGLTNTFVNTITVSSMGIFAGTNNGVFFSDDNGANWRVSFVGVDYSMTVLSILVVGTNVFAGGLYSDNGIYVSADTGKSWTFITNGLMSSETNAMVLVGSTILAGGAGGVFKSEDSGASWVQANSGLTGRPVSMALIGSNIFLGANEGVYLSTDTAKSWTLLSSGLSDYASYPLAQSGTSLFGATTGNGMYSTSDNGANWSDFSDNLPLNAIYALTASGSNVFAGTDGGGVWKRALADFEPCSSGFSIAADSNQLHHYIITNNASGKGSLHYDWSWGDGSHDTVPYPTHTFADSGFYDICLSITDSTGCQSTFCDSSFHIMRTTNYMIYMTVVPPVILKADSAEKQLQNVFVYPNPVTNLLMINTSSFHHEAVTVSILNVLGRLTSPSVVLREDRGEVSVDVSELPAGIYFLQLKGESGSVVKRFVKE